MGVSITVPGSCATRPPWRPVWVCTGAVLGNGWVYCRGIAAVCSFLPSPVAGVDFSLEPLTLEERGIAAAVTFLAAVLGARLENLRAKTISAIPLDGFKKRPFVPVGIFFLRALRALCVTYLYIYFIVAAKFLLFCPGDDRGVAQRKLCSA